MRTLDISHINLASAASEAVDLGRLILLLKIEARFMWLISSALMCSVRAASKVLAFKLRPRCDHPVMY